MTDVRRRAVMRIAVLWLLGITVALVCVRLGVWQLDRLDQRRAANAAIVAAKDAPVVELSSLAPAQAADLPYQPVSVAGIYDPSRELILYGRSNDGVNGNHVLTPLEPSDGGPVVIVDRGWVPFEMDTPPLSEAPVSNGQVTVVGTLRSPEASGGAALDSKTVSRIDLTQIEATIGRAVFPMTVVLASQDPPSEAELPIPQELPELGEGPHFSYALQWFAFAAIAIIGTAILAYREPRRSRLPAEGA